MLIFSTRLRDKNGSETVYALLRHAFSSIYTEAFPEIKKTPAGKPYFPERPDVQFSLSHTKTHVLCAISDAAIGCDIEPCSREISNRARSYFCTPEELLCFSALDLWILKESYIKLLGGTFASIRNQQLSLKGDKILFPDPSVFSKLYSVDGCRAAVCSYTCDLPESIELI